MLGWVSMNSPREGSIVKPFTPFPVLKISCDKSEQHPILWWKVGENEWEWKYILGGIITVHELPYMQYPAAIMLVPGCSTSSDLHSRIVLVFDHVDPKDLQNRAGHKHMVPCHDSWTVIAIDNRTSTNAYIPCQDLPPRSSVNWILSSWTRRSRSNGRRSKLPLWERFPPRCFVVITRIFWLSYWVTKL
jgi:hypothetical protein